MVATKSVVLLEHHLKALKLPTILREYASLAVSCTKDRADYVTYLLRLSERELLDRERRSAERRVRAARFPVLKSIDTFDFKAQASINESLVRELLVGEYIDHRENVLAGRQFGHGKDASGDGTGFGGLRAGTSCPFLPSDAIGDDSLGKARGAVA